MSDTEIVHRDWLRKCFCYEKVSFGESDSDFSNEASNIIDLVCRDLHIAHPKVLWLRPADPAVVANAFTGYDTSPPDTHPKYARIPCSNPQCSDEPGGYTPRLVPNEIWILMTLPFRKLA